MLSLLLPVIVFIFIHSIIYVCLSRLIRSRSFRRCSSVVMKFYSCLLKLRFVYPVSSPPSSVRWIIGHISLLQHTDRGKGRECQLLVTSITAVHICCKICGLISYHAMDSAASRICSGWQRDSILLWQSPILTTLTAL